MEGLPYDEGNARSSALSDGKYVDKPTTESRVSINFIEGADTNMKGHSVVPSRFVAKIAHDISKYATVSPMATGGISEEDKLYEPDREMDLSDAKQEYNVEISKKDEATEQSLQSSEGLPHFLRNLVDNAKLMGSLDSTVKPVLSSGDEKGDDYDDDEDVQTNYDNETFTNENDDMLSVFSGHTLSEADFVGRLETYRANHDAVSADLKSYSLNEIEEDEDLQQYLTENSVDQELKMQESPSFLSETTRTLALKQGKDVAVDVNIHALEPPKVRWRYFRIRFNDFANFFSSR